jgi:hypothetical protein
MNVEWVVRLVVSSENVVHYNGNWFAVE